MKIDFNKLGFQLVIIALVVYVLLWGMFACRSPKQLHDKAILKGYVEKTKIDSVLVAVPVKGDKGKDTTIFVRVPVDCPDPELPKTRQEEKTERTRIKYEYKTVRDTLQLIKYVTKQETKKALKKNKNRSYWWAWIIIGWLGHWYFSKRFLRDRFI